MEKSNKKIWIISIIGTLITIFGIITGSLWPLIYDWTLFKVDSKTGEIISALITIIYLIVFVFAAIHIDTIIHKLQYVEADSYSDVF
jgi:carbon starvation protein CstA